MLGIQCCKVVRSPSGFVIDRSDVWAEPAPGQPALSPSGRVHLALSRGVHLISNAPVRQWRPHQWADSMYARTR